MIPLLLPTQSLYLPGQAILVEATHPGDLVVTHLGERVRVVPCDGPGLVDRGIPQRAVRCRRRECRRRLRSFASGVRGPGTRCSW